MPATIEQLERRTLFNNVTVSVFHDINGNGQREAGEPLVDVGHIYAEGGGGGHYSATYDGRATLDLYGPQETYRLKISYPSDWRHVSNGVAVLGGETAPDVSNLLLPAVYQPVSAAGVVYHDLNANGVRDAGEPDTPGGLVYNDIDENGVFTVNESPFPEPHAYPDEAGRFNGVFDGWPSPTRPYDTNWVVKLRLKPNYGWRATDPDALYEFTLGQDQPRRTNLSFGVTPHRATVKARAFYDNNSNGLFDTGDERVQGPVVYMGLNGTAEMVDGTWIATREPGTYAVGVAQNIGERYNLTTAELPAEVTLTNGQVLDLGEIGLAPRPSTITGTVYTDTDRSRRRDDGDTPAAGIWVRIVDPNHPEPLVHTTITDANGAYSFVVPPDRFYRVEAIVPQRDEVLLVNTSSAVVRSEPGMTRSLHMLVVPAGNISDSPTSNFNGDAYPDLVINDPATGKPQMWYMGLGRRIGKTDLAPPEGEGWTYAAAGDFTADDKTDVLWQNIATGQLRIIAMDGVTPGAATDLATLQDKNWRVVGAGDFNGDGKMDIAFRRTTTGHATAWFMDGTSFSGYGALPWVSNLQWSIVAVADQNDDGQADLLWWNQTTKRMSRWAMNGLAVSEFRGMPAPGREGVNFLRLMHYNNDGMLDLLWGYAGWKSDPHMNGSWGVIVWVMNEGTPNQPTFAALGSGAPT